MTYKSGDIVIGMFPFTDLTGFKKRPLLVLGVLGEDVLVVPITSQSNNPYSLKLLSDTIVEGTLIAASCIRYHRLTLVHASIVERKIGAVTYEFIIAIKQAFVKNILQMEQEIS